MNTLKRKIESIVGTPNVFADEPMSAHTTFRIGGPADVFVTPKTVDGVQKVVQAVRASGLPLYILGRGSNVLVSDEGIRGVVVQIASNLSDLELSEDGTVRAHAGVTNAKLAAEACRNGLSGYEFAAGIPGTVGGAAIMNAGAYDGEFKQVALEVTCLNQQGEIVVMGAEQADWGYRNSALMRNGLIVLKATLRLHSGDPVEIQERMDELARRRQDKQPLDKPSAGSTFKRPEGHFAGKLIQDAGMQGYRVGGAQVSTKHAGFVVNVGGATASDVMDVIRDVQERVYDRFGVQLQPEVRFWGFD